MYVVIFEQKIFSLSQFLLSLFSKASKNHFFQIINPSSLSLSIWNNQFSLIKFAFQILKAVRMFCLLSPISICTWMQVFSEHQLGFGIHSLYWYSHLSQVLGGKLSAKVSTCRRIIFVFHIFPSALAFFFCTPTGIRHSEPGISAFPRKTVSQRDERRKAWNQWCRFLNRDMVVDLLEIKSCSKNFTILL